MSKYPEHEKIEKFGDSNRSLLYEFIEFLESKGYEIVKPNDSEDCYMRGYARPSMDKLPDDFIGINQSKLESERVNMLESIRNT